MIVVFRAKPKYKIKQLKNGLVLYKRVQTKYKIITKTITK